MANQSFSFKKLHIGDKFTLISKRQTAAGPYYIKIETLIKRDFDEGELLRNAVNLLTGETCIIGDRTKVSRVS